LGAFDLIGRTRKRKITYLDLENTAVFFCPLIRGTVGGGVKKYSQYFLGFPQKLVLRNYF
jgi:hypothetical protein